MARTWGGSTWNGTEWGFDVAPARPAGVARLLLAAEADAATACVVTGQLQSRLEDDWLQHDTLTATVQAPSVPGSWGAHALVAATQEIVQAPATVTASQPFGRYRLVGGAGATVRAAPPQRTVQGEDWLRAQLLRPWHEGFAAWLVNPPQAAAALLYAYTGQTGYDVPFDGASLTGLENADFVAAGNAAFGTQVALTPLLVNWSGVAPAGDDRIRLTTAGYTDGPTYTPDPVLEADAAFLVGSPFAGPTYATQVPNTLVGQIGALPPSLNGVDTLALRYWQEGTGFIGPTLLLSVVAGLPVVGSISATADGITLLAATSTFTTALWAQTWEGAIFAVLWLLTGSTGATPWVTADGALALLSPQNGLALGLAPLALLSYERTTRWLDWLGELCRGVQPGGGGKTNWGMQPLTLTYDATGVLHLRRAAERWGNGWGWSTTPATPAPVPLPLAPPVQDTPGEPQYDHLRVYYPGQSVTSTAGVTTTQPPLPIAEAIISPVWAPYDPDWERLSELTIASTGLEGVFVAALPFGLVGWITSYTGRLLDELVARLLGAARPLQLTLAHPWAYPRLTQLVSLRHPAVGLAGHYRLEGATTPLGGGLGTWQLAYRAPWTVS